MRSPQIDPIVYQFILEYILERVVVMSPLLNHHNEKPLSHKGLLRIGLGGFEPPTS